MFTSSLPKTTPQFKIFLSYTKRDIFVSTRFLAEVARVLSPLGEIFVDCIHNDSKNPQDRVINELSHSSAVILLATPQIMESPWVRLELSYACRHNIPIFTCFLGRDLSPVKSQIGAEVSIEGEVVLAQLASAPVQKALPNLLDFLAGRDNIVYPFFPGSWG